MVEFFPSTHKALDLISSTIHMVLQVCNPSTQEVQEEGLEQIWVSLGVHSYLDSSLGFVRPCLRQTLEVKGKYIFT